MSVDNRVFWVRVTVLDSARCRQESLYWFDLPWAVRVKWNWYFEYRAALLKVKYPRFQVVHTWGNEAPATLTGKQVVIRSLNNLRLARVRKITELERKIQAVKDNWQEIFPFESHELYQKVVAKIERLKCDRNQYERDIARLQTEIENCWLWKK